MACLNEITPDQLAIVGVEFADPEQHNTSVTLSGTDLDAKSLAVGGGVTLACSHNSCTSSRSSYPRTPDFDSARS
ncbi:MAG: hypothetical protein WBB62_10645 [Rhodococcus sp. (in: high G+C Gram-positive bacteria)]